MKSWDSACAPDAPWDGMTKAQVQEAIARETRAEQESRKRERRAEWRRRNPEATCGDFVADMLAELEEMARPKRAS